MKVSVVVTVLNEEKSIDRLINALTHQTKKPDEIIIVDGGSLDATASLVSNFQFPISSKKTKVKLFIKPGNRSVGRNYGIEMSRNETIAVTDAGGYPARDWLAWITTPFRDKAVKIVSGYYRSLAQTPFEKCITPYFLVMPDKLYEGMEFLPSSRSLAFRKSIWEKVGGYPEGSSHNEDLVFDYNLKKAGVKFYFEPEAIVWWQPPRNLRVAFRQFFRFALGDAESGIKRGGIKYIFLRYLVGMLLLVLGFWKWAVFGLLLYIVWSITKNFRYTIIWQAIIWLPIIQITSDLAVMFGYSVGMLRKETINISVY